MAGECKKYLLIACCVSMMYSSCAQATVNVATEAELRTALGNIASDSDINITATNITLTSDLTMPTGTAFTITGNGQALTTNGYNLTLSSDASIKNLVIDGVTNYNNNSATDGAGVYNYWYSTNTLNGDMSFSGNTVTNNGAGINNSACSTLTINGNLTFSNNTAAFKGAGLFNEYSTTTINGDVTFSDNTANAQGGGIFNSNSTNIINGNATFTNNAGLSYGGGGIYNSGSSTNIINGNATFTGNTSANYGGGAFFNTNSSTSIITGNSIFSNNTGFMGGALYNESSSIFIAKNGATFTNNSDSYISGAIYSNNATTTLIADTNNVEFTGNTTSGADRAIYLANSSTLNLNASNNAKVIFNDKIATDTTANVINLNKTGTWDDTTSPNTITGNYIPVSAPTTGEIILNADMSEVGSNTTVNLYGGTLTLGSEGTFFTNAIFNAYSGSTLNLINNKIDSVSFNTANINNMNLKIDVDLDSLTSDTVNATTIDTNNTINISQVAVINDNTAGGTVTVDPDNEFSISLGTNTATGNVYNYSVANNGDGTISLSKININPVVQAPAVTTQNACAAIAAINNISFSRADDVMSTLDILKAQSGVDYDMVNKVAALKGNAEYSTLYDKLEKGSVWFKPFSNIEQLDVKNIEKDVNSVSYGMVIGYDSPLKKFRHGYKGMFSLYGGQNGANQSYDDVTLYQEGGFAGVLGALYKKNFYASLSANAGGSNIVEKVKGYGSANYGLFTTSVASKLGYNFHLPKNITVQLNGQTAYSYVSSKDYTNSQGTRISSDPLHVIQLTPGLKISKPIGNWQPYLSTSMVFNPLYKSKILANNIVLPETSLGRYVEYGLGIEKYSKNNSSGFVQATMRNGSRTGVNLQFGIRTPIGKKKPESL